MAVETPSGLVDPTGKPASCEAPAMPWASRTLRNEIWELVKSTYAGWTRDKAPRLGASLAFYTLLSMAPMIIVVVAVAGLAFGSRAAEGRLLWEIRELVGEDGAHAIQGMLRSAHSPSSGILATVLGLLTLFFGATNVVNELRDALNTIWRVPEPEDQSNLGAILSTLKSRIFSFTMVLGIGFLLLVSLAVNAWLAAAGRFFAPLLPAQEWVLQIGYLIFSFLFITGLFAVLLKVLPDVSMKWRDVLPGAALTSLLFSVGKSLIGLYLGKTSFANTYGAAGSLVIVIVWVYYSAQIFFLGAEFTCVYAHRYGSPFRRTLEPSPEPEHAPVIVRPDQTHLKGKLL